MSQKSKTPGSLMSNGKNINLYFLNQLYSDVAELVSQRVWDLFNLRVRITSGIWGGTYLIADKTGQCLNRVHRLYCIINFPQNTTMEENENFRQLVKIYSQALIEAFEPHGICFKLEGSDEMMPYSNREKPSRVMHFSDRSGQVMWLRAFFVWNQATWEESIIHDTLRNVKVLKELLNIDRRPIKKNIEELKFLLQDVVITYRTLENILSQDFVSHAEPLIDELTEHFLAGLHDPNVIWELYLKAYNNALVYGLEEALKAEYALTGLSINQVERWPASKINFVPDELKEILVTPIKNLFAGFKENLDKNVMG